MPYVTSADGVRLAVDTAGDPAAPSMLFIHGFSQSFDAWDAQFAGELSRRFYLVRFDLRGHGRSDKPEAAEAYLDARRWADDVDAILGALHLSRTMLVGWSYGGFVIADYLRFFGDAAVGGIVFAGAVSKKGVPEAKAFSNRFASPLWPMMFSDEESVCVEGLARFVRLCNAAPLDDATFHRLLGTSVLTPSRVRRFLQARVLDNDDVWARCTVPALAIHGTLDGVVTPAAAEYHVRALRNARYVPYEGIGHTPFREAPARFDRDLTEFAASLASPMATG